MKKETMTYQNKLKYGLTLSLLLLLAGCQEAVDLDKFKSELRQADISFSEYSEANGMNAAFAHYCADDGVVLADNSHPVVGKEHIQELFSESDENIKLVWKPQLADVASSGEMGYTFGLYEMTVTDSLDNRTVLNGTYVTVWKKDQDGNWKFVLDAGTEGLSQ